MPLAVSCFVNNNLSCVWFYMVKVIFVVVVIVFSLSKAFAFCDYTTNNGIDIMHKSCPLFIASELKSGAVYFIQFSYVLLEKTAVQEVLGIAKEVNYPVAIHHHKDGYRLLVGPVIKKNISSLKEKLSLSGYSNVILKSINIDNANSLIKTYTKKQLVWKKFGRINSRIAMMPLDENGRLHSYASDKFEEVCKFLGETATIATYEEYMVFFSTLSKADDFGLKYRFWLTNKKTIARNLKNIVIQNIENPREVRPFICIIDVSENSLE